MFEAGGHDTRTVSDENLVGTGDDRLIDICKAEDRWLVTFDVGFGDIRAHPPGQHAGVLLLRLRDQQPSVTLDILRRVLAELDFEVVDGAPVIATDEDVRIRRP